MKRINSQGFFVLCLIVLLIIVSWVAIHYALEAGRLAQNAAVGGEQNSAVAPQTSAETQALVAKVSALMVLPSGETPTVATVVDPSLLGDQPFFANARKGDAVLIYTGAKEAIIYDPSANKIVAVSSITIGSSTTAQ